MSDESGSGEAASDLEAARREAALHGVGSYGRHILICTGPDCCTPEEGGAAWKHLKNAVAHLNARPEATPICRTKVGCLRVCESGPVGVVYPEGRWYAGLEMAALDRVIEEDLEQGRTVEDHLIGENPLPRPTDTRAADAAGDAT